MSTPPRPLLKSITTTPTDPVGAPQPVDAPAVGAPKGVAEGVPRARVLALITDHEAHRDLCPLRTPQEERAAA
ncbi:hypothetical protein ACFWDP_37100 [Streptomyces anthocyanicus]|uniref:hypothetical protein n=1 Tax=Streptomyces TaxID=1883 RepID=UPI003665452A